MTVRVLLVDDHEIMREGMCALLQKCGDMEVVGQAADGRAAFDMVNNLHPNVVIMDVGMPNLNGIESTRQMMEQNPSLKVMGLSTHSEVHIITKMFQAGACGYMHKNSAFSELKEGIMTILKGQIFLCSHISKMVSSDYTDLITQSIKTKGEVLSSRECEVVQLVAEGHSTKEIAKILKISSKTVDSHRGHIMEKLDIRNIAGLTKYAIQNGLTRP